MKKRLLFIGCLVFMGGLTIQSASAQTKKTGQTSHSNVTTSHDKFEGTTTYTMKGNKVKIKGAAGNTIGKGVFALLNRDIKVSIVTTRLQLENHITKDGTSNLAVILSVSVHDDARFYPAKGESLVFLADGKRIGLSTKGKYNAEFDSHTKDSKVFARYPITQKQLDDIIQAKQVEFRLLQGGFMSGKETTRDKKDSSMEGHFSAENFKAWTEFYNNYIINKPKL